MSSFAVYRVDPDSAALFSLDSDYGISTASADDDWYSSVLQNLEWIMFDITDLLEFANEETSAFYTFMYDDVYSDLGDICEFLYDLNNSILGGTKNGTVLSWLNSLTTYFADTANWLGVYDGGLQLNELLSLLNSSVVSVDGSVALVDSALDSFLSAFNRNFVLPAGQNMLGPSGSVTSFTSDQSFWYVFTRGLMGLNSTINSNFSGLSTLYSNTEAAWMTAFDKQFTLPAGTTMLGPGGSVTSFESPQRFFYLISRGLIGLSTNIKAISDGSYSLSIFDSDSADQSSVSASTMGAMMSTYFDSMQDDLGALTFILADSETIQAKKDAASNTAAVTDSFLDPDADASLSVSDIGDAAAAVVGVKDLFDTGVSVDLVFEQLESSGPLSFFTSETASQLNTVPATVSNEDDDFIHFYDPDNSEFFALIGKGGD